MLYPRNYYKTKKAFKEAVKDPHRAPTVYSASIFPYQPTIVRKKFKVGGKMVEREVIVDSLTGPSTEEHNWYAEVYLDPNTFEVLHVR